MGKGEVMPKPKLADLQELGPHGSPRARSQGVQKKSTASSEFLKYLPGLHEPKLASQKLNNSKNR